MAKLHSLHTYGPFSILGPELFRVDRFEEFVGALALLSWEEAFLKCEVLPWSSHHIQIQNDTSGFAFYRDVHQNQIP
jgi:hypothetical protein